MSEKSLFDYISTIFLWLLSGGSSVSLCEKASAVSQCQHMDSRSIRENKVIGKPKWYAGEKEKRALDATGILP